MNNQSELLRDTPAWPWYVHPQWILEKFYSFVTPTFSSWSIEVQTRQQSFAIIVPDQVAAGDFFEMYHLHFWRKVISFYNRKTFFGFVNILRSTCCSVTTEYWSGRTSNGLWIGHWCICLLQDDVTDTFRSQHTVIVHFSTRRTHLLGALCHQSTKESTKWFAGSVFHKMVTYWEIGIDGGCRLPWRHTTCFTHMGYLFSWGLWPQVYSLHQKSAPSMNTTSTTKKVWVISGWWMLVPLCPCSWSLCACVCVCVCVCIQGPWCRRQRVLLSNIRKTTFQKMTHAVFWRLV